MRRYILTLAIAVTCGGCDIYGVRHPGMVLPDPAEKPSATRAYLYGRFAMQPADVDLNGNSMADPMSAAVIIRCKDGNEYTIPFMSNQPVLFEIAPSTCMMSGIVFMNHGKEVGRKEGERAHFRGIMENAEFAPGVAYYLGDFVMGAAVDRSGPGFRELHGFWHVESAYDGYEQTTDAMKRLYRSFAKIPTEKRLLDETLGPPPPPDPALLREQERQERCRKNADVCHSACDRTDDRTTCLVQCGKKAADCRKGP